MRAETIVIPKNFAPGDLVMLTTVRHDSFRGLVGEVRRVIKSRGVLEIRLRDGRFYDAFPGNVTKVEPAQDSTP